MGFLQESRGKEESHSIHISSAGFLWPIRLTRLYTPKGISIGSAVFARLTLVTNTETDKQRDRRTN